MAHADRLLAWEFVHGQYCAGKHLRPRRLAERTGLTEREVNKIIDQALQKARGLNDS